MKKLPLQTKAVGDLLGVTDDRVRQLVKEGRLHAEHTASGTRLFDEDDVKQLAKERAMAKKNK